MQAQLASPRTPKVQLNGVKRIFGTWVPGTRVHGYLTIGIPIEALLILLLVNRFPNLIDLEKPTLIVIVVECCEPADPDRVEGPQCTPGRGVFEGHGQASLRNRRHNSHFHCAIIILKRCALAQLDAV